MYQVMIVDDEQMSINSLALGFDWKAHGFDIIATATSSTKAYELISFLQPDIVFTDIRMPGLSGIELMRKVQADFPRVLFVVISGHAEFEYVQQALTLGAKAYCLKPLENEEIADALQKSEKQLAHRLEQSQIAFQQLYFQPTPSNAVSFLDSFGNMVEEKEPMAFAVSSGNVSELLAGNVRFSQLPIFEESYFYVITSNAQYLESSTFQNQLLSAASEKNLRSFVYLLTQTPVDTLIKELPTMFDYAFHYFIDPAAIALGPPPSTTLPKESPKTALLKEYCNQNRTSEVLEIINSLRHQSHTLTVTQGIESFGLVEAMLARMQNEPPPAHTFPHTLLTHYSSMEDMLFFLEQKLMEESQQIKIDLIQNKTLQEIILHIGKAYDTPLSFRELCEEYAINPSYLSQLFKKELGITYTKYVARLRIQRAKELLATTNLRVIEISEQLGYPHYPTFTKQFKQETGYTPMEYRQEHMPRPLPF